MFFFPFKKKRPKGKESSDTNWTHHLHAEVYEPRLVLTAQPLVELAHHTLLDHTPWDSEAMGRSDLSEIPLSVPSVGQTPIPTEPHRGWIGLNDPAHPLDAPHGWHDNFEENAESVGPPLAWITDPALEIAAIERLFEQLGE